MEQLTLNPYAFISEVGNQFVINASPRLRYTLSNRNRELIDYLTTAEQIDRDRLRGFLSADRIEEMIRKRVLIVGKPLPREGRYSRQMGFLSFFAGDAARDQAVLGKANVLLLGAGAVGSHVLWNLAAIGVGQITVVDFDTVEESNLNRQLMYWPEDIGRVKVEVICERIGAFNPNIIVTPVIQKIETIEDIRTLLPGHHLVVKSIDTPVESNDWVNEVCVEAGIPYVTGGFLDNMGVVGPVYIPGVGAHCLACLDEPPLSRIHGTGPTFAPLTTIVSSMIAMHAFKILVGQGAALKDQLLMYDVLDNNWSSVSMTSRKACKLCGSPATPVARPVDPVAGKLIAYRTAVVALTLLASIMRLATGNASVGVMMVAVLFASTLALDAITSDQRVVIREIFVAAILYTLIATVTFVLINGLGAPPAGAGDIFGRLQRFFSIALQACLSATVLTFLLILFRTGVQALLRMARRLSPA
ncbi:HesA/MoeB/ThiF family protein [Sphingomonas crusticola]|uniref:HesA/MoeB/ThiF family protein n=1 Tax=Sphingomonas crusticola TaxID=1697973 RepID=UPI000E26A829|nr:HesA/MoeB/ThiF family protein [Sphingomonas crusticola]